MYSVKYYDNNIKNGNILMHVNLHGSPITVFKVINIYKGLEYMHVEILNRGNGLTFGNFRKYTSTLQNLYKIIKLYK